MPSQSSWKSTVLLALALLVAPIAARAQDWSRSTGKEKAEALLRAADEGDARTVRQLIDAGADVNWTFEYTKTTALQVAAASGRLEIVQLLLDRGADPRIENSLGKSALDRARESGQQDVARLLERAAAAMATPAPAPGRDWSRSTGKEKADALLRAADEGDARTVRELIAAGVDVNWTFAQTKTTAIQVAAANGRLEVVRALLAQGADPRLEDWHGQNALDRARQAGQQDVVRELARAMGVPARPAAPAPAPAPGPAPAPVPGPNAPGPNAPAPTGARPRPGRWVGEITNRYVGKQTIEFTVSADGSQVSDVKFRGYWLCRSERSSSTDTKDLVNLDPPGAFAVTGGAFANEKREPKSRMFWSLQGQFTSPTTATGKYRATYAGTQCDTWGYVFTARRR